MLSQAVYMFALVAVVLAEVTAPGIDRTVTEGVNSMGFRVVYRDEEMTVLNQVVSGMEKEQLKKSKVNLNELVKPLPADDVKCLMSVDRYCSKDMRQVKSTLILALKDECRTCSDEQKNQAGHVAASMMAHDSHAWKMFLTRYGVETRVQRIIG